MHEVGEGHVAPMKVSSQEEKRKKFSDFADKVLIYARDSVQYVSCYVGATDY
jgi:hypothetical protein